MISLWVIVDRLAKVAHFTAVKTTYIGLQLIELYVSSTVLVLIKHQFHATTCRVNV
jgi:hypothetical protein